MMVRLDDFLGLIPSLGKGYWDRLTSVEEMIRLIKDNHPLPPALTKLLVTVCAGVVSTDYGAVKREAVRALGLLRDPDGIPVLVWTLETDRELRFLAADSMAEIGGGAATWPLIKLLGYRNLRIREAARHGLVRIGQPAVRNLIESLEYLSDPRIHKEVVRVLGEIRDPRAVPTLIKLLTDTDKDWEIRHAACRSLGQIRDPGSIPTLVRSLADPELVVRHAALESLRALGDDALTAIQTALEDEDSCVRDAAREALNALKRVEFPR